MGLCGCLELSTSPCPLGGSWEPSSHSQPNTAASSIKSDLGRTKVMGQPESSPPVDRAWAGEEERRKAFLRPGPTMPAGTARPSASLSGLSLLLLLLWVDPSVCLSV